MKLPTLVILSGGMDSTVLAYHTAHSAPGHDLIGCVSVNYGQRHSRELQCAAITCADLGVRHHLLNLSSLRDHLSASSLTSDKAVPEGHYEADNMKDTVVPNRNMILIALATGVAISIGAKTIAYGAHAGDHAVYPDCRSEFAGALASAIELCDYDPPKLARPFINKTKKDIVQIGMDLKVPFDHTWTCYKGEAVACGRCGTCVERLEAFAEAGYTDPIKYVDPQFWKTVSRR